MKRTMKRIYLLLALAVVAIMTPHTTRAFMSSTYHGIFAVPGRAYYVDSINGNDTNNGLSPSQAFMTIAHLTAADATKHINTWKLADNSHWREELNVPRNNMIIEAYGQGARPILDGSDIFLPAQWSKTGGYTNLYQATVTLAEGNTSGFVNILENGAFLHRATSQANCDATAGTYWPGTENAGANTVYIHATADASPITNGAVYEITTRAFGIRDYPINCKFYGLETRQSLDLTGSFFLATGGYAKNMMFRNGSKHNVIVQDATLIEDSEARGAYYNTTATLWVYYVTAANTGMTATCNRCRATMPTAPSVTVGGAYIGFFGHAGSGTWGPITYNDCYTKYMGTGFGGGQSTALTINNPTIVESETSFSLSATTNFINGGSALSPTEGNAGIYANGGISITVRNLTLSGGRAASGGVRNVWESGTNIDIQNSSLTGWGTTVQLYSTGVAGNIVFSYDTLAATDWFYVFGAVPTSLASDYNIFTSPGAGNRFKLSGNKTYTQWKALGIYDQHSTP